RFDHPFREYVPSLFGARHHVLDDQLLLRHAGRARQVERLGDLGERAHPHILNRGELDHCYFLRGGAFFRGCDGGTVAASLRYRRGLFTSESIRFHSSSSPSPVTAETGSTEFSNTDSSFLIALIRSPRASLSILVATRPAAPSTAPCIHCHAVLSLSRRGRRASTSRRGAIR